MKSPGFVEVGLSESVPLFFRKALKRPPLFLRSVSRTEKPPRMGRRRHTIGGVVGGGGGGGGLVEGGKSERELLKERLQQELAEECAVEMMEGGVEAEEPHATPRGEREDERKEEEVRNEYIRPNGGLSLSANSRRWHLPKEHTQVLLWCPLFVLTLAVRQYVIAFPLSTNLVNKHI